MADDMEFEENWVKPVCQNNSKERKNISVREEGRDIPRKKIRVAVIGAGISGLCALKHMMAKKGKFLPTVYEKGPRLGGIWIYNEQATDTFGLPTHSCIYKNLRTNTPKPLMTFPGFPHADQEKSYISHNGVLRYIEEFSNNFQLNEYIQLNTMVTSVQPIQQECSKVTWEVICSNLENKQPTSQEFDAVLVCNGHHYKPYIPKVVGIETFTGEIIHSREYRMPGNYKGKTVLVIGASESGLDIGIDIATTAKQVLSSHRHEPLKTILPTNVKQRQGIHHMNSKSVIFVDETEEDVDAIIFCTGYQYDFPFLSGDIIQIENQRVMPLYKHMLHIKYQNLIFIGITKHLLSFPHIHEQAYVAVAILEGAVPLPSEEEMKKDADEDYRHRKEDLGMKKKDAHLMSKGDLQWIFNEDLASLGGIPPLPKVLKLILDDLEYIRKKDALHFRERNYRVLNSASFEASPDAVI